MFRIWKIKAESRLDALLARLKPSPLMARALPLSLLASLLIAEPAFAQANFEGLADNILGLLSNGLLRTLAIIQGRQLGCDHRDHRRWPSVVPRPRVGADARHGRSWRGDRVLRAVDRRHDYGVIGDGRSGRNDKRPAVLGRHPPRFVGGCSH